MLNERDKARDAMKKPDWSIIKKLGPMNEATETKIAIGVGGVAAALILAVMFYAMFG